MRQNWNLSWCCSHIWQWSLISVPINMCLRSQNYLKDTEFLLADWRMGGLPFCSLSPFHLEESGMKGREGTMTTFSCWLLLVLLLNGWTVNTLFVSGIQRLSDHGMYMSLQESSYCMNPFSWSGLGPTLSSLLQHGPGSLPLLVEPTHLVDRSLECDTSGQMPLSTRPREPLKYLFHRI